MKKGILFISMILLSGCSASYHINIDDNIKETLNINFNSEEFNTFNSNSDNKYIKVYFDDENDYGEDGSTLPLEGVKYYNYTEKNNIVTFDNVFDFDEFHRSGIVNGTFNNFIYKVQNNELYIETKSNLLFRNGLDNVTAVITTPYKVLYSNADSVNNNSYYWYFNKDNYNGKRIKINISLNNQNNQNNNDNNNNDNDNYKDKENNNNNNNNEHNKNNENKTNNYLLIGIVFSIFILVLSCLIFVKKK